MAVMSSHRPLKKVLIPFHTVLMVSRTDIEHVAAPCP